MVQMAIWVSCLVNTAATASHASGFRPADAATGSCMLPRDAGLRGDRGIVVATVASESARAPDLPNLGLGVEERRAGEPGAGLQVPTDSRTNPTGPRPGGRHAATRTSGARS